MPERLRQKHIRPPLGGRFFVYLARFVRDGSGGVKLQVEEPGDGA